MTPTEIKFEAETQTLHVSWDDESIQSFPCWVLRGFCPCAHCQGHGGGPPQFRTPLNERALTVENVTPVGNYGMCVIWADGHDTAIYSFAWLRRVDLDHYADEDRPKEGTPISFIGD